jgi:hypothetical protein
VDIFRFHGIEELVSGNVLVFVAVDLVLLLHDTFSRSTSHPERLPNTLLYVKTDLVLKTSIFCESLPSKITRVKLYLGLTN